MPRSMTLLLAYLNKLNNRLQLDLFTTNKLLTKEHMLFSVVKPTFVLLFIFKLGSQNCFQLFSHTLTFKLPWSLGYIRKLVFVSPWGKYFTSSFMCSQHTVPRNSKLAQTPTSQSINSNLGQVEPQRFISCALRNPCKVRVTSEPQTSQSADVCATSLVEHTPIVKANNMKIQ